MVLRSASHLVRSYDRGQRESPAEEHSPRYSDILPSGRHRSVYHSVSSGGVKGCEGGWHGMLSVRSLRLTSAMTRLPGGSASIILLASRGPEAQAPIADATHLRTVCMALLQ